LEGVFEAAHVSRRLITPQIDRQRVLRHRNVAAWGAAPAVFTHPSEHSVGFGMPFIRGFLETPKRVLKVHFCVEEYHAELI